MAKVQSSKSGKMGVIASGSQFGGNVVAVRDGEERTFRKQLWDNLPPNKEGWVEKTGKPADIPTQTPKQEPAKDPATTTAAPKEAKPVPTLAELEKVDVSKLSSADKRKHTIALKKAKEEVEKTGKPADNVPEGMVAVTVDQEFLDLHPEQAANGIKVGETIYVPKSE